MLDGAQALGQQLVDVTRQPGTVGMRLLEAVAQLLESRAGPRQGLRRMDGPIGAYDVAADLVVEKIAGMAAPESFQELVDFDAFLRQPVEHARQFVMPPWMRW